MAQSPCIEGATVISFYLCISNTQAIWNTIDRPLLSREPLLPVHHEKNVKIDNKNLETVFSSLKIITFLNCVFTKTLVCNGLKT